MPRLSYLTPRMICVVDAFPKENSDVLHLQKLTHVCKCSSLCSVRNSALHIKDVLFHFDGKKSASFPGLKNGKEAKNTAKKYSYTSLCVPAPTVIVGFTWVTDSGGEIFADYSSLDVCTRCVELRDLQRNFLLGLRDPRFLQGQRLESNSQQKSKLKWLCSPFSAPELVLFLWPIIERDSAIWEIQRQGSFPGLWAFSETPSNLWKGPSLRSRTQAMCLYQVMQFPLWPIQRS